MDERHTFIVEVADDPGMLIRVLGPFAVQEAQITAIRLDHGARGVSIAIEASGVTADRAALIARRLQGLAAVRAVGLGWKSGVAEV
jgi:ACT domain-containing protein